MGFISKILGYRGFSKKEEIIEQLKKNKCEPFNDQENFDKIFTLIFFKTRRQQTWLFATNENLYCVLDDISLESFDLKWNITKKNLIDKNEVILNIKIHSHYTDKSGKIDFGEKHKGWLYSKALFKNHTELKENVSSLIVNAMT